LGILSALLFAWYVYPRDLHSFPYTTLFRSGVRSARPGRGLRDLEQLAHLLEREVQRLHPTDQQDPFDIRIRVEPEAARGALRGGNKPDIVVVSEGAQIEIGALDTISVGRVIVV